MRDSDYLALLVWSFLWLAIGFGMGQTRAIEHVTVTHCAE